MLGQELILNEKHYYWQYDGGDDDDDDDDDVDGDDDNAGAGLCFEHSHISQPESCIQIVFPFLKLAEHMSRTTKKLHFKKKCVYVIIENRLLVPLLTCIPNVWIYYSL